MTRTAVTLVPDGAIIRDLRVTDIRCQCGAGPGDACGPYGRVEAVVNGLHASRIEEHDALVAAGYQWQEPDDKEPPAAPRVALCCARVRSPSGLSWFCSLADGHDGDHHGLSRGELAQADFGPKHRRRGA